VSYSYIYIAKITNKMKQTDFTYIKMRNKGQDVRDEAVFHAQNKRQQIKKEKLFVSPFGMKSRD